MNDPRSPRRPWPLLAALACALTLSLGAVAGLSALPARALADDATLSADRAPQVSSPVALLQDRDTGTVLYEKDADARRYPASITKVMTALVVLEHADLDDSVTTQESDFDYLTPDSSTAGLKAGETLTVRDLLACLLIPSGNDAAYVLARAVGGDVASFVELMNERAEELGCTGTHFVNPCGLHDDNHYTTARDLVKIFDAALAQPEFSKIAGSATWDLPATEQNPARTLTTTDFLSEGDSPVFMGDAIVASKTGYTDDAGKCLITAASRDGMNLVGVVLGASNVLDAHGVTENFYDMRDLLEWGFGAWQTGEIVAPGDALATVDVELSSTGDEVAAVSAGSITATVPRGTTLEDLTVSAPVEGSVQAPIEQGQSFGDVTVSLGERALGTVGVQAASAMELSVPDFVLWWLSDPVHAIIVVVIVAAVLVTVGLAASSSSRRRRRGRYEIAVGQRRRVAPGAGGQRLETPGAPRRHGAPGRHAASGRHTRR